MTDGLVTALRTLLRPFYAAGGPARGVKKDEEKQRGESDVSAEANLEEIVPTSGSFQHIYALRKLG